MGKDRYGSRGDLGEGPWRGRGEDAQVSGGGEADKEEGTETPVASRLVNSGFPSFFHTHSLSSLSSPCLFSSFSFPSCSSFTLSADPSSLCCIQLNYHLQRLYTHVYSHVCTSVCMYALSLSYTDALGKHPSYDECHRTRLLPTSHSPPSLPPFFSSSPLSPPVSLSLFSLSASFAVPLMPFPRPAALLAFPPFTWLLVPHFTSWLLMPQLPHGRRHRETRL